MRAGERIQSYINGVQHLRTVLKSMSLDIHSHEMAYVIFKGLTFQCANIITSLDVLGEGNALFFLKNVKSRLLQDQKRRNLEGSVEKMEVAFLNCTGYPAGGALSGRTAKAGGHTKEWCLDKYTSLRRNRIQMRDRGNKRHALMVEEEEREGELEFHVEN